MLKENSINKNIFLYPCNIVGYFRIFLIFIAFISINNPMISYLLIGISRFLDIIDGPLSRKYSQSTKFGAYLDIIADYSTHIFYFLAIIIIDNKLIAINILSELIVFYSIPYVGLLCNKNNVASHKELNIKEVSDCHTRINMFFRATLKELLFIPYILQSIIDLNILSLTYKYVTVPLVLFSTICNVYMLYGLMKKLVEISEENKI